MKRIFPNVYSKVLKGKKSKCHHLVPRVCLCWHHTCAHIHFPQGSVRVSSLPELSKLSSLRFPEPGSLAPRRHRLAAPPLSSPCTPHLTSPSPGNHGPPPPGHPSLTHQAPLATLSPYPPQYPKSPIYRQGWAPAVMWRHTAPGLPDTARYEYCSYWSYRHPAGAWRHPQHCHCHNKWMGTRCRFPSCYFIHFAAKIAEVSQLADKTWGWWLLLGPGVCGVGVLPPPSAAAAGEQRNFSSRPAAEWTQSRGGRAAVRTWRRGAPARGTTMISQHVFTGPRGNDGHCCFV